MRPILIAAAVLLATSASAQQSQLGGLSYANKNSNAMFLPPDLSQKPVWGPPPPPKPTYSDGSPPMPPPNVLPDGESLPPGLVRDPKGTPSGS